MLPRALYSYERHFLYSKKFLSFVFGVLPGQNYTKRLFFFAISIICMLPHFLVLCYQFFIMSSEFEVAIGLLQKLFISLNYAVIHFTTFSYVETRNLIYTHVKEDYEMVSDNEELNIIERVTKQMKRVTLLFTVLVNVYVTTLIIIPMFKIILYHLGISNDINRLTLPLNDSIVDLGLLYYCLFIYQIIIIYILAVILISSIAFYLVLIKHASTQFSIIMMKIRRPFLKDNSNNNKLCKECDWMIDIIKRYRRVTELIDLINDMTNKVTLIIVFFMMLVVMLNFVYIFQMSIDSKYVIENIDMVIFIGSTLMCIFINFYVGQDLLNHSTMFFDELRQVPFHKLTIKTQKLLLFLLTRSMRPSFVSIGRLFVTSNEVLASLLQKAFSFATVYYNMQS